MSFIHLRFTYSLFDISVNSAKGVLTHHFARDISCNKYICSLEKQNKRLDANVKPHLHILYYTDKEYKKETLQKKFREKIFQLHDIKVKGNCHYCIQVFSQPDDEDRWWRYAIKEKGAKLWFTKSMSNFIKDNLKLAQDEYARTQAYHQTMIQKYLDKSSFKGKMFKALADKNIDTHKDFIMNSIKYYIEKKQTPPFTRLNDMFWEFQILNGKISYEDYYYKFYSVDF